MTAVRYVGGRPPRAYTEFFGGGKFAALAREIVRSASEDEHHRGHVHITAARRHEFVQAVLAAAPAGFKPRFVWSRASFEWPNGARTHVAIEPADAYGDRRERSSTEVPDGPVHQFFELSYASHLVLPRSVLQSMPLDWQGRLVDLMDELDATIDWREDGIEVSRREDGRFARSRFTDYERGRRRVPWRSEGRG